jgi:transposase-like protein
MPRKNGRKNPKNGKETTPVSFNGKYDPDFCQQALQLLSEGKSICSLSSAFGVSPSTIQKWKKQYPAFAEAVSQGVVLSQHWWEEQSRLNLNNRSFQWPGWIVNMRNRFSWKGSDPQEHRMSGKVEHTGKVTLVIGKEEAGVA